MKIGKRDRLVTFQRAAAVQDDYGEEVLTWSDLCREWAAVFFGRGSERRQAAQEAGQQAATFVVLRNSATDSVVLKDRIVMDGENWDIEGIAPMDRAQVEFTAVRGN